jgi:hypothetical protein
MVLKAAKIVGLSDDQETVAACDRVVQQFYITHLSNSDLSPLQLQGESPYWVIPWVETQG